MKVMLTTYAGVLVTYEHPLSVTVSDELYTAGGVSCTVPADEIPPDFAYIKLTHDGTVLFYGMVDKQTYSVSEKGRLLQIDGRDFSGLLLDNEAKPVVYETVTLNDIYKNHVSPYGIGKNFSVNPTLRETFTVSKGMSEFEVVSKFCRAAGFGIPAVGTDKKLTLRGDGDGTTFGDGLIQLKKTVSRYKLISEIIMSDSYDRSYSVPVKSGAALAREVTRKRYRRFSMLSESEQHDEAAKLLAKSAYGSREYTLSAAGIWHTAVGNTAVLHYQGISEKNLVICERTVHFDDDGLYTEFVLVPSADLY